jgi:DNA-binding NarL/FixJ family response regulator
VLLEGDDQRAESSAHDALKVLMDHGWRPSAFDALDILAEIALYRREHERAVRLAVAAREQRSILGLVAFPDALQRTERQLAAADAELGEEKFKRAKEEGTRLSLDEAVAYAQRGRGEHTSATFGWGSLSPVERQVAGLASQGLNNPGIARELFMARNTVKVHLSRVYAKLGVANRTELARLAAHRTANDTEQAYPRG